MNIDKQKIINEYLREKNKVYNAYHVGAKLSSEEYSKFWKYCTKNNLNKNSAIKKLINSHPEINDTNTN
tara:strand:+ start:8727 stop:8933 length:207 start_codon:yes stop_codon:yes gene_type:complete